MAKSPSAQRFTAGDEPSSPPGSAKSKLSRDEQDDVSLPVKETAMKNKGLALFWMTAVAVPWALLLAPHVSRLFDRWLTSDKAQEPSIIFNTSFHDTINNCTSNDALHFQMGSLVEVLCGDETDNPDKIYWCKATIIGVRKDIDDTYIVNHAIDQTQHDAHISAIRRYMPPEEHELVQYFAEDLFHACRIDRVHKDGTVNIYVAYYDSIIEDVSPDLLRRVESRHKPPPFKLEPGVGFQNYLNPKLFEDPETLEEIAEKLQNDKVVVIHDAFVPEFAEAMWYDLSQVKNWKLHQFYDDDGFHYSHHNIYDSEDYSSMMNDAYDMFDSVESKMFIGNLAKRDVSGDILGSPSYYMPGDYSMPHSDFAEERTVAFVWHLSKNWEPEWGGALYWSAEGSSHAFQPASFNTLSLFNVRFDSLHFVTKVAPHAMEKRLTFNGWWYSKFTYDLENVPYEDLYATPEEMNNLSREPSDWLMELELEDVPLERREKFEEFQYELENFFYPEPKEVHGVFPEEL